MEFFVTCKGIPVRVCDTQKGAQAIVLLHGYLETLEVWDDFVKQIAPHFRVLRIDLPGHGLSGTNPAINTVDFSAAVLQEVFQKCAIPDAVLVGHSMGSYVAQVFAVNYSELVRGLAFFHSTPNPDSEQKKKEREREIALIREGKLLLLAKQSFPNMFAADNAIRLKEKITALEEIAEIHEPEGIIACLEGMKLRPDRNEWLQSFNKPLLLVFGEKDYYISKETAQNLVNKFPQAQVLWLKNSGHSGFLEEPETVAEKLITFATQAYS